MIYEYRLYRAAPGKMPALHARFRDITLGLFKRHGIRVVAFWQPLVGAMSELHYIVEWDDLAHLERGWESFRSDPNWVVARAKSEEDGPLVAEIINQIWTPTDYSPRISAA